MKNKRQIITGLTAIIILILVAIIFRGSEKLLLGFFSYLGRTAIKTIEFLGYPGLVILMALESMIVPLPSELVMPFAGFLVSEQKMNLALVVIFSSLGSLVGSLISYYLGYYGGNKLVLKIGRWLLLDVTDLEKTEKWFEKKGKKTIFVSRFIPVVRHLISIPAGLGKMNLKEFCLYTMLGASLWNGFLAYLGYLLGKNWTLVRHYSEDISLIIAVFILAALIYFIWRHLKNKVEIILK